MKIALLGIGKMGQEVEMASVKAGHFIVTKFGSERLISPDLLRESGAEVAIDFTQPSAVVTNVRVCAKAGVPLVIGTTGWEEHLEQVKRIANDAGIGVIMGSNFSVGVNLFLQIVRNASRLVNGAGYDAYILEEHHRAKKDHPSGTALRLSEMVLSGLQSKHRVLSDLKHGEAPPKDALVISSIRAGAITGTHTVGFDGPEDTIELVHRAKNRGGFASGAVRAAEWIRDKKGFYRFEEHITDIIEN